ncbi:HlyD family type I secretion periplasmic adaptor subunit [Agrobacterium sp. CCNWLW71]|uniref:HlyD family type I secretion periplasmic adaptor subunit n=1 Tax=unclassified Agrobacterium TaxID=2632611 RepID=UPI002FF0595B
MRGKTRPVPTGATNTKVSDDYSDFLPAALEIIEKPASPVRYALMWFVCTVAASALIWSFIGRIDVVATAQGKVQPSGRVKVVQSTISGRVVSAPFANGTEVKAGDLLVKLDDIELKAEDARLRVTIEALQAEHVRRMTELVTVENHDWSTGPDIAVDVIPDFAANTQATIRLRETAILKANLLQLKETMRNLAAQTQLQSASIDRLQSMSRAQANLITTLTERVSMRSGLLERAAGRKSDVLDATQALREEEATLSTYAGQLLEAQASLAVAETEKNKVLSTFVADNIQKSGDLARQMDEAQQELVKAEKRLAAAAIYAPSDGVVQASSITTTGQVVSAETEIMRIIPANLPLEIEVFFANQDVGFVKPGQPAVIKVETFPFTRYGVLTGTVKTVARDAIPNPDAQAMEEQAAPQFRSVVPGGNVQRLQNLVYPATIALDTTEINVDGVMRPLSPGMAVSVEIKTGTRRIIDYFWSPVARVASEAMQER